ncbi:MAG: AmpG family muropeptide MFS transporter, partial [Bacteroidales bacterium]|nr:AmpG family muropeptide MFS transporter [Bacteroidales bacterium]
MISTRIPALSENASLRYLTFSALYFAQGIPLGLLMFGLPAWMAINGVSAAEIGVYVAIVGIPWSFKILAAPVMDRFTFLLMGRRRPWIIFGQLGLVASFLLMAFIPDPLNHLTWLATAGFMINLFTVFQDIAVDGLAIDIVPENEQARANGLMWGSKTLGKSAAVAAGIYIINAYNFFIAVSLFSLVILFIMMIPVILRERPGERIMPWSQGMISEVNDKLQLHSWIAILKSLFQVFFLPVSLLMGVAAFSFSVGRGIIDTLLPVFTVQELGWTDSGYSNIFAYANLASGVLGMFVAGAMIDFFGKIRMVTIYLILLISVVIGMSLLKVYWGQKEFITGFIFAYYILETFLVIAVFATAMQLCWKRISATQFTLFMAISNLGHSLGSALLGPLKEFLHWEYVILSFILFALIMLVIVRFIHFDKHLARVNRLE